MRMTAQTLRRAISRARTPSSISRRSDDQRRIEVCAHVGAVAGDADEKRRHRRRPCGACGPSTSGSGHVGDVADHAGEKADRRHLLDARHALAHAVQLVAEHAFHLGGVLDEVLVLGHVEGGERGRAGDRMAGIGVEMEERRLEEDLVDPARDRDRAHRDVAAGQALGVGDDVALSRRNARRRTSSRSGRNRRPPRR